MNHDEPSSEEINSIDQLPKEIRPPDFLEEQTVSLLHKKGLVKDKKSVSVMQHWLTKVAAAIIFFIGGYFAHDLGSSPTNPKYSYMFLFHENEDFSADTGDTYSEYSHWAGEISQSGINITGDRLGDDHYLVGQTRIEVTQNKITGFMVLGTTTLEEALKIAAESPHVRYGGTIEVRPIDLN